MRDEKGPEICRPGACLHRRLAGSGLPGHGDAVFRHEAQLDGSVQSQSQRLYRGSLASRPEAQRKEHADVGQGALFLADRPVWLSHWRVCARRGGEGPQGDLRHRRFLRRGAGLELRAQLRRPDGLRRCPPGQGGVEPRRRVLQPDHLPPQDRRGGRKARHQARRDLRLSRPVGYRRRRQHLSCWRRWRRDVRQSRDAGAGAVRSRSVRDRQSRHRAAALQPLPRLDLEPIELARPRPRTLDLRSGVDGEMGQARARGGRPPTSTGSWPSAATGSAR